MEDGNSIYFEELTERETEVLHALSEGLSNKEIANKLFVEVSTVKWYNAQIYGKLEVKNRKEAVLRARTLGLIKVETNDLLHPMQHNLPADILPFIGRTQEIQDLIHYVIEENSRLITILGPGGMGKSRLAIEVGRRLLPNFSNGVYFIPLASVTSREQIITTIADAIGLIFHSDMVPEQQLLDTLQNQRLVLLIDNFEHLTNHVGLLADILNAGSEISMLVTSREKLGLNGEQIFLINGLSTRNNDTLNSVAHDAAKLFAEVARRTTNTIDNDNIEIVTRICQKLGGMPLAILLSAAWLDTLTLPDIEQEINNSLELLNSQLRNTPKRHQSIESVFEYSWNRLHPDEQAVFMSLSVFREGFTREAARAITNTNIHQLQRLVHTSFIQHQASGRYTIHELMRQYGEKKLIESQEHETIAAQHAQYFAEVIAPLNEATHGMVTGEMLQSVAPEFENIRAAWTYLADRHNFAELRRFLDGIWLFLDCYNRSQEGIDLYEPLLREIRGKTEDETLFRGQLMSRLASFYADVGRHHKAEEIGKTALAIIEEFDSPNDTMHIYHLFQLLMAWMNRYEESSIYAKKLFDLAEKFPTTKYYPPARLWMWPSFMARGEPQAALDWTDSVPEYLWQTFSRAQILMSMQRASEAEQLLLNGLNKYWFSRIHFMFWFTSLAQCAIKMEELDKSWHYIQRGLYYGDSGPRAWGAIDLLIPALQILIMEGDYQTAVEMSSIMLHHPLMTDAARAEIESHQNYLKTQLSPESYDEMWNQGEALSLSDLITSILER